MFALSLQDNQSIHPLFFNTASEEKIPEDNILVQKLLELLRMESSTYFLYSIKN